MKEERSRRGRVIRKASKSKPEEIVEQRRQRGRQNIEVMERTITPAKTWSMTETEFLARRRPISKRARPGIMPSTSTEATTSHAVSPASGLPSAVRQPVDDTFTMLTPTALKRENNKVSKD